IHGNSNLGGTVLTRNGQTVGSGFRIAETDSWIQTPSLFYVPSEGVFLAVWYDTRTGGIEIRGRLLRLTNTGTPVFLTGDDLILGMPAAGAQMTAPPGIAYSTKNREFLVVWQGYPAKSTVAVLSRRMSITGTVLGSMQSLIQG